MSKCCVQINSENDIYLALQLLNHLSFSDMDKQKVIVSVSELTRNILDHANSDGYLACEILEERGLRVIVRDYGKGIHGLEQVLKGEPSSNRHGLGLGLAGAKRMMDEFKINTSKEGTTIVCTKWRGTRKQRT